jgi:two-component system, NtrC family, sensor histidine kinase HydH
MIKSFFSGDRFNLLHSFAISSLLCICLISIVSSYIQSRFLTEQILLRDATVTSEFLNSVVNAEASSAYFKRGPDSAQSPELKSFFNHVSNLPDVMGANVYDPEGRLLWSTNTSNVKDDYGENDELSEALGGKLVYEDGVVGETHKKEHVMLQDRHLGVRFVEMYVPIRDLKAGQVVGVVEIYKVPIALDASINEGLRRLWLVAMLGAGVLFASLFWIVRRATQLISRQNQQLTDVKSLAAIGETVTAVAHNIRNPLAAIRASAELSLNGDLQDARESAADIISEADRLTAWTRDLLAFSKMPYQDSTLVDINQQVLTAVGATSDRFKRANVSVKLSLGQALPMVRANTEPLNHVLASVFSNALDAMQQGGQIRVSSLLDDRPGQLIVLIEDSGPGMNSEQLERALKPFYTTKAGGTGLGIPLSRQIMQRSGGDLSLGDAKLGGLAVKLTFLTETGADRAKGSAVEAKGVQEAAE